MTRHLHPTRRIVFLAAAIAARGASLGADDKRPGPADVLNAMTVTKHIRVHDEGTEIRYTIDDDNDDDVIETASANPNRPRMRLGEILSPALVDICTESVSLRDLLRIAPAYAPDSETPALVQRFTFEERSGDNRGVDTRACAKPDFTVQFKDAETNLIETFHSSALRDIVPKLR